MASKHPSHTVAVTGHYTDRTCRWRHLSRPSPELLAAPGDGWLPSPGRALDIGCGPGVQAGYLAAAGWQLAGIDLSQVALTRAPAGHDGAAFMRADVRRGFGLSELNRSRESGQPVRPAAAPDSRCSARCQIRHSPTRRHTRLDNTNSPIPWAGPLPHARTTGRTRTERPPRLPARASAAIGALSGFTQLKIAE
jgi:SAM-dependent methyltransferase